MPRLAVLHAHLLAGDIGGNIDDHGSVRVIGMLGHQAVIAKGNLDAECAVGGGQNRCLDAAVRLPHQLHGNTPDTFTGGGVLDGARHPVERRQREVDDLGGGARQGDRLGTGTPVAGPGNFHGVTAGIGDRKRIRAVTSRVDFIERWRAGTWRGFHIDIGYGCIVGRAGYLTRYGTGFRGCFGLLNEGNIQIRPDSVDGYIGGRRNVACLHYRDQVITAGDACHEIGSVGGRQDRGRHAAVGNGGKLHRGAADSRTVAVGDTAGHFIGRSCRRQCYLDLHIGSLGHGDPALAHILVTALRDIKRVGPCSNHEEKRPVLPGSHPVVSNLYQGPRNRTFGSPGYHCTADQAGIAEHDILRGCKPLLNGDFDGTAVLGMGPVPDGSQDVGSRLQVTDGECSVGPGVDGPAPAGDLDTGFRYHLAR